MIICPVNLPHQMPMNSKLKRLDELYDKIPNVDCKGLCYCACTQVPAAKIEINRTKKILRKKIFISNEELRKIKQKEAEKPCYALCMATLKCNIYDIRPAICRLYGAVKKLKCPFGCEPDRYLTDKEALDIMTEINTL